MSESATTYQEFEQNIHREIERTFLPVFPGQLEHLLTEAEPVAQAYLSHPSEEFSLRVRETTKLNGEREYTATLKDRGSLTRRGLDRLEVEIAIDENLYRYYQAGMPTVYKHRAKPLPGFEVDFYPDNYVLCEAESEENWKRFAAQYDDAFVDITADSTANNEWRAHLHHRQHNHGHEALVPQAPLTSREVVSSIIEQLQKQSVVVARVAGRSGSGKSTMIREVEAELASRKIGSVTLSTDDYHRGKTWLERYKGCQWTEWDAPIVYNLEALANDIQALQTGESVAARRFDFSTEEPAYDALITPQPVILIEGIYAKSPILDSVSDVLFEIATPLATCVGRRLLRDMRERPQFADPEKSLRYILEQAEPAYREQTSEPLRQN